MINNFFGFFRFKKHFKKFKTSGFSLLELALVIIVIGLIVVGVLVGRGMVETAKVSRAKIITGMSPVGGISKLSMWLETTNIGAIVLNESGVVIWRDFAVGSDLKQSDSDKCPSFINSAVKVLPAIKFDGINDFLEYNGTEHLTPTTIFIVFKSAGNQSQDSSLFSSSSSDSDNTYQINYDSSGLLELSGNSNSGVAFSYPIESTENQNATILAVVMDGTSNIKAYLNGASVLDVDIGGRFLAKGDDYKMGTDRNESGYFNGYIAELILFEGLLDNEEMNEVEDYLSSKYNISLSN